MLMTIICRIIIYLGTLLVGYNIGYNRGRNEHTTDNSTEVGEWLEVGHDNTTYFYRCSICGHEEHDNMTKHDKFCSSCGHPMK